MRDASLTFVELGERCAHVPGSGSCGGWHAAHRPGRWAAARGGGGGGAHATAGAAGNGEPMQHFVLCLRSAPGDGGVTRLVFISFLVRVPRRQRYCDRCAGACVHQHGRRGSSTCDFLAN